MGKCVEPWIAIIVSAFLLQGAYMMPVLFSWLVFIFLVPIFYSVFTDNNNKISALHGFLWAGLFFGIHWYALFCMIFQKVAFPYNGIVNFLIWLLAALQGAFWFWTAHYLTVVCSAQQKGRVLIWLLLTTGYFVWLYHGMFFFLGGWYGYCCALPLLPLAEYPVTLQTLKFFGPLLLTFFLILFALFVTLGIVYKKKKFYSASGVCLLPFLYGIANPSPKKITPHYVAKIGWIKPLYNIPCFKNPLDCAQYLNTILNEFVLRYPSIELIILPESSYPFPLNKHTACIELLSDSPCAHHPPHVLASAHRTEGGKCYNSLFVIHDKEIKKYYDKTHLVPIAEYIPSVYESIIWIRNIFLHSFKGFTAHTRDLNGSCEFEIPSFGRFKPLICADFFIGAVKAKPPKTTVICTVNDALFTFPYFRHLLYLYAVFKACEWEQDFLYISHYYGVWINDRGKQIALPSNI